MNAARHVLLFVGIAGLALGGCGSGSPYEHAKVHGKVTYKGQPVTFGSVLFMPVDAPPDGMIQPASGSINPDGTYELSSQTTSGAVLGEHKVLVIAVEGAKPGPSAAISKDGSPAPVASKGTKATQFKSAIPKKYADPATSTLKKKVESGDNTIDIELTN